MYVAKTLQLRRRGNVTSRIRYVDLFVCKIKFKNDRWIG